MIPIESPVLLLGVLFLIIALTRFLENQATLLKKITSAVLCTLTGIALSNAGVIPHESPLYDSVFEIAIPYAIVLVILASRLSELARAGSGLVICFGIAGVGSFAGGLIGGFLFRNAVGPESWKLAGQFVGAFFGGGMNYAAIGQELATSDTVFAAGAVAINLTTVPWLLAQMGLAGALAPYYGKVAATSSSTRKGDDDPRREWIGSSLNIAELAILAAVPLAILFLARQLQPFLPWFPEVLWITTLALIAAQLPFFRELRGTQFLAYFAMHLFFIVIGANSIISEVLRAGPSILLFMMVVIAVHAAILFGVGWLLRYDIETLAVASQAAVGGPGSALALSMSMNWSRLTTPGVIVGIFGYAFGNYLGIGCAYLLRGIP